MRARILRIATGALLGLLVACGGASEPGGGPSPALMPGGHSWTAPDGNTLPYDVAGSTAAKTSVIFIHGWMGERGFWDAQLPALAEAYRTITLDLPGHGRASANRTRWTCAQFGDDVAELLDSLALRDVVLVGHSMGGPVALRAAALSDGRVRGVIGVDSLHDAEFEFTGDTRLAMLRAFEMDYENSCRRMTRQMFPEMLVDEIIQRVSDTACGAEKATIGSALMNDFAGLDLTTWFEQAGVPIRAINSAAGRPTESETNAKYADFDVVLMEGVGHYPFMTRPDDFNMHLLAAVHELAGD